MTKHEYGNAHTSLTLTDKADHFYYADSTLHIYEYEDIDLNEETDQMERTYTYSIKRDGDRESKRMSAAELIETIEAMADEDARLEAMWENGEDDEEDEPARLTRGEIVKVIEDVNKTAYSPAQFSALPYELMDGVERFWEPGYDYADPDFWTSYEDTRPDFIEAVIRYDLMKKETIGDA